MVELERVLIAKLDFDSARWREVEMFLTELAAASVPAPAEPPEAVSGDADDDLILACALRAGVDILVSGDRRHLLPVGEHAGVRVMTPQALLAELRQA